jgi:hypothetical protein
MAVASLMQNETEEMQQMFTLKLNAMGICKMKDLAFILGNELDAEKASKEIFGEDHCIYVQSTLLRLWQSARAPGKAAVFWDVKQDCPPASTPVVTDVVPAFILPLKVKDNVGLLLVKTTMAVLTTKASSPSASSSSSTSSRSLKADMSAEWRKVLILCMQFLKEHKMFLRHCAKMAVASLMKDEAYEMQELLPRGWTRWASAR